MRRYRIESEAPGRGTSDDRTTVYFVGRLDAAPVLRAGPDRRVVHGLGILGFEQRVFDVVAGELAPILVLDALAQVELDLLVVRAEVPAFGQSRLWRKRRVVGDQLVVDLADGIAVVGGPDEWIQPGDVAHDADAQRATCFDLAGTGGNGRRRVVDATEQLLPRFGTRDVDTLRDVPTEQVREASQALAGINPTPGQVHTPANLVWYPTVAADVVRADSAEWSVNVPVLIGCTQDEARFFVKPDPLLAHPEVDPADAYT